MTSGRAKLLALEHKEGKEALKVSLVAIQEELTLEMFGSPDSSSERMNLCLYNDNGDLLYDYEIDLGGAMCGRRPCWLPKSTKGFSFVDKSGASSGINKLVLLAGSPGKGKAIVKGTNNAKKGLSNLPLVSGLLSGNSSPTVQLISESGLCIGGNMTSGEEKKPGVYNAKS
jgi:hypothetical protein